MTTTPLATPSVSRYIGAELRAELARQNVSARHVARTLEVPPAWMSRRIGRTADVDLTFEEVERICGAAGLDADTIVIGALRACRDSNPKPSDLCPVAAERCYICGGPVAEPGAAICLDCAFDDVVNGGLTVDRSARSAWRLAA